MPLQSKKTVKVFRIPVGTTEEQFLDFVRHLCTTPKRSPISSLSFIKNLKRSPTTRSRTSISKEEGDVLSPEDQDDTCEVIEQLRKDTTYTLQNDQPVGTISFCNSKFKDVALARHAKDLTSPWKDWIVTDDFQGVTILSQGPNIDDVNVE
jgi:hypothetical protein